MPYSLKQFPNREALFDSITESLNTELSRALEGDDNVGLVLSGGKTPVPIYERMSELDLPWSDIWVTLTDERWVEPTHEASNEGMVRATLLQNKAKDARFIPIYTGDDTPEKGEVLCHNRLSAFPWHNMICLLGMGNDGHIASLFPHNKGLERAINLREKMVCLAQTPDPLPKEAPYTRMTLTLSALLSAHKVYLVMVGEGKVETLERAEEGDDVSEMPVRGALEQAITQVQVYWAP